VPTIWATPVYTVPSVRAGPTALAIPKSITFTTGATSWTATRTFEGLRSRWMISFWWACGTARHTCRKSPSRSRTVSVFASQ
jgi:hypothetical protein